MKHIQIDYNEELLVSVRSYDEGNSGYKYNFRTQLYVLKPFGYKQKLDPVEIILPENPTAKAKT